MCKALTHSLKYLQHTVRSVWSNQNLITISRYYFSAMSKTCAGNSSILIGNQFAIRRVLAAPNSLHIISECAWVGKSIINAIIIEFYDSVASKQSKIKINSRTGINKKKTLYQSLRPFIVINSFSYNYALKNQLSERKAKLHFRTDIDNIVL